MLNLQAPYPGETIKASYNLFERIARLKRIPEHIGIIPDGNRRWAQEQGLSKESGYFPGLDPGMKFISIFRKMGIKEISIYGFTKENTRRPAIQVREFRKACAKLAQNLIELGISFIAIGDTKSNFFPKELKQYTNERTPGDLKINLLVNYNWHWDLYSALEEARKNPAITYSTVTEALKSKLVSKVDLVIRWGGRNRLSGFLPIQTAYADFISIPSMWPDATPEEFVSALEWYQIQDPTRGG